MSSTFCPLPFMHLASHPAGYVTLCCEADHTGLRSASYDITDPTIYDGQPSFYNLKFHSMDRVVNSQSFNAVRKQMLNDVIPPPCRGCFAKEEKGLESKRTREMRNFPHFTEEVARSRTSQDGTIAPAFEFVELRLGNICNARCVTCNPLSSSQWRNDYLELSKSFSFIQTKYQMMDKGRFVTWPTGYADSNVLELDWSESQNFWDELFACSHHLKVIYINGGEPTLIKCHWEFLEKLIASGLSENIELHYSINTTLLPDRAIETWKRFKKVRVSCSIDALFDKNVYIRFPSNWDDVLHNITELREQEWLEVSICQTISAYNYDSLAEFYEFFSARGIYVYYNFVHDPAYMSPAVIPVAYREQLHTVYRERLPSNLYKQCVALYGGQSWDEDGFKKFVAVTHKLDSIRGTSFEKTFPDLAKWLL